MIPEIPELDDIYLEKLIEKLKTTSQPKYVEINPDFNAGVNECFPNVDRKIETDGGKKIIGWSIWKTEVLIEAEFHAIWQTVEGEYLDITPKSIPMEKILFIEDNNKKYNGCQVDNIRLNISGNSLTDDLIILSESIFSIENKGKRAAEHQLHLEDDEARFYGVLQNFKINLILMIKEGLTKNQTCFCGKMKYKKCHGKIIKELKNSL
ncbi:MAG: hypothetical protein QM504_01120 [Pseudomonadota bacterium]